MRIERAVTTVSWIPSDSLSGMLKAGEKLHVAHHDEPPPDQLGSPAEPLLEELREEANRVLRKLLADDVTEIKLLQEHLHDALGGVVYDRTRRRPMVLPVIVEV